MNCTNPKKNDIRQIGLVSRTLSLASLACLGFAVGVGSCVTSPMLQEALVGFFMTAGLLGMLLFLIAIPAFIVERIDYYHSERGPGVSAKPLRVAFYAWFACVALLFFDCEIQQDMMGPSMRSKIARVKGDQRTLTIALDTYYLDNNAYPAWSLKKEENAFGGLVNQDPVLAAIPTFHMQHGSQLATLTTPISYISSLFTDPFAQAKGAAFAYWSCADRATTATGYIIWSPGPDGKYDLTIENVARLFDPRQPVPSSGLLNLTYDPSNGAQSGGDVYRCKR